MRRRISPEKPDFCSWLDEQGYDPAVLEPARWSKLNQLFHQGWKPVQNGDSRTLLRSGSSGLVRVGCVFLVGLGLGWFLGMQSRAGSPGLISSQKVLAKSPEPGLTPSVRSLSSRKISDSVTPARRSATAGPATPRNPAASSFDAVDLSRKASDPETTEDMPMRRIDWVTLDGTRMKLKDGTIWTIEPIHAHVSASWTAPQWVAIPRKQERHVPSLITNSDRAETVLGFMN